MKAEQAWLDILAIPTEQAWDAFCATQRDKFGQPIRGPRRPQPIVQVGTNATYADHVQLAFPMHWWHLDDLVAVDLRAYGTEIVAGTYIHKKGGRYRILHVAAVNESDLTPMVVYVSLRDGKIWCRPSSSWLEPVEWPAGHWRPRFMRQDFESVEPVA